MTANPTPKAKKLLVALRLLLRQIWAGSAVLACPESYLGGGWEPGACEKCEARESCGN